MLKEILKKDEISAMKARDKAKVSVLRLKEIIENGSNTVADIGKIMKEIMPKISGRFDRSKINSMVKALL